MREFKLTDDYTLTCESLSRRGGFKHEGTLLFKGQQIDFVKICYVNRTWESFEFASVLNSILDRNPEVKKLYDEYNLKQKVLKELEK